MNVILFENDSILVDYYSYVKNLVWDIILINVYVFFDFSVEFEVIFLFWLCRKFFYYINNLIVFMVL